MKNIILYIAALATFVLSANSQTLRIERTDVDSARYGHVTANFKFGIDIYIDDLENVNSSSFQLQWNFGDYVHFSGYKIGDFGDNGTVYITPPKIIAGTSDKFMNVGIFSGTTIGENDFDSPKLLHLEFAVSNDIPNRESLNFTFVNFFATAFIDSSQTNVEISTEPLTLNIHSFINVWPGDSNNDGLVDTRDYNQIGLYFEGNTIQNNGRTFKRKNSSIMWTGQKVLVWDNADATFADCDGDGVITVADGMVVFHNDAKTHTEGTGLIGENTGGGLVEPIDESKYRKIPVFSSVTNNYRAMTANAKLPEGISVKAVIAGDLFEGTEAHIIKTVNDNILEFTIGSFESDFEINQSGIIAYLLVEEDVDLIDPIIVEEATILNNENRLLPVSIITGIDATDKDDIAISIDANDIRITTSDMTEVVKLYNINGRLIKQSSIKSNNFTFQNDLESGTYLLLIENDKVSIKTIQILK
ncbi:MAG: T9SS type A sorting domain-containing protein [Ignavibacteriae bacterium]|nr:T9SS type A sorting domain-containing protein [Ignavibacteriota bacterium]MCB9221273.1 T9SS type A sorting domain-containing protein [Ignavibacteria bacterium]